MSSKREADEIIFTDLPDQPDNAGQKDGNRGGIKSFLPRSLLGRSLLILVLPVFLIQAVTTVVFFDNHLKKVTARLAYAVSGEIAVIANAIEDKSSDETLEKIKFYVSNYLDLIVNFQGEKALSQVESQNAHDFWEGMVANSLGKELEQHLQRPFLIRADFDKKVVQIDVKLKNGVLSVSLPERRLFSSSGYIFLIWMFVTSFVVLLIAVVFMRNQIRPIRKLAVAAEWFGRGRDAQNFKVHGAREVRQAGQAFLDMRRRIRRQISQRTLMLAGVSHDLRTPLTRLKLQLSMMPEHDDVNAMKSDLKDMEDMIAGYLDFVQGTGTEDASYTNLRDLVLKILDNPNILKENIVVDIEDGLEIMCKPIAIQRCLSNLIMNATRFANKVWISAKDVENKRIQICIEDNGPGVDEDQYEDVFKPFFRLESSRNNKTGGVGLGMPIAMDIVHSHGGKIWLEKSSHGGLGVTIRLPI